MGHDGPADEWPGRKPAEEIMTNYVRPLTRFDDLPDRAKRDPLGPPKKAVQCRCLHCDHEFSSDEMVWYRGFWMCPKITCGGAGFLFDIYPVKSAFWNEDEGDEIVVDEWGVMSIPCGESEEEAEKADMEWLPARGA